MTADDVLSRAAMGRLVGALFLVSGIVTGLSPLLPAPPGVHRPGVMAIGVIAFVTGLVALRLPWHRWSRRAPFVLFVPAAHVLIALHNHFGATDPYRYGLFFMVAYVWVGLSQPPRSSLLLAPLTVVAYLAPLVADDRPAWALFSVLYAVPIFVLAGEATSWVSERLRHAQQALTYQARHDHLTGLPNRAQFVEWGEAVVARARREDLGVAVLFLDLDGFKQVNDTLGHAAGDRLLTAVAARLGGCIRAGEMLARMGGDEFALLAAGVERPEEAQRIADRIGACLERPFELGGAPVEVGASIGVAWAPADRHRDVESLLRLSDGAMYRAKAGGGRRSHVAGHAADAEASLA